MSKCSAEPSVPTLALYASSIGHLIGSLSMFIVLAVTGLGVTKTKKNKSLVTTWCW